MGKRDDFTQKTKTIMAQRVGYNCSNPDCKRPTAGSHTSPQKATLIGVAAHITAAASGGPRFDDTLSKAERKGIENGIWLCENCARLIDKDERKFSVKLLNQWKVEAETISFASLQKNVIEKTPIIQNIPFLELDLIWSTKGKGPIVGKGINGLSPKNREVYGDTIPVGRGIYYNLLKWNYNLIIYNNSSFPAYNIKIVEDTNFSKFSYIDKLSRVNNLPALDNIKIKAKFQKEFEGTGVEAMNETKPVIPPELNGKRVFLEYKDELRNDHRTEVILTQGGILNNKA